MTDAERLLAEATPLPWEDSIPFTRGGFVESADYDLIVYAVNRLPAYEAAVGALERIVSEWEGGFPPHIDSQKIRDARAALARLRETVPA